MLKIEYIDTTPQAKMFAEQIKGEPKTYFLQGTWGSGSNEQCNGLLRQFFPKGKSMHNKTNNYVQRAMNAINEKPRKLLHYCTAQELFYKTLAS